MNTPADPTSSAPAGLLAVIGNVERGDARGRQLGFPTLNLPVEQDDRLDGVWAGWVDICDQRYAAAISIGNRPTFYGASGFRLLEAHLLDFDADVYGELTVVWLATPIRAQQRFGSIDELVAQLRQDVEATRLWAAERGPHTIGRAPRAGTIIRVAVAA